MAATASSAGALLLGGATLIAGVFVGKIAVDAIQGDAEPDDNSFGEAVRLVASLAGLSVTIVQLPSAWQEIQNYLTTGAAPSANAVPAFIPGIPGT